MRPAAGTACGSLADRPRARAGGRRSPSRSDHRDLGDVDLAAAKTALAVHEIIAPKVVEFFAEARQGAALDGVIVAVAPALERFGIVEAEAFPVLPRQAPLLR